MPGGAAEGAVVGAFIVLIASELTVLTERRVVEIVAIAIEEIFGKIFVVAYPILPAKFAGFSPGLSLNFEELDIGRIICFADEIVAELMQK